MERRFFLVFVGVMHLVIAGCTSTTTDSWLSPAKEGMYDCSNSKPILATGVRLLHRKEAVKLLEPAPVVPLGKDDGARFAGSPSVSPGEQLFLVRALLTVPRDGSFGLTLCGSTLFVDYVAPPTGMHVGIERGAVVVALPVHPEDVFVTAGEGVE